MSVDDGADTPAAQQAIHGDTVSEVQDKDGMLPERERPVAAKAPRSLNIP